MNFSLDDRRRSLRRFLMMAVGSPPWTVYVAREHVADDARPAALIEPASPAGPGRAARISIPQGNRERRQTFSLMLFPAFLDGDGNPLEIEEARLAADTAAQQLEDALALGLIDDDGSAWSAPERLPMFDFAGVAVSGELRAGPAESYGWMWVDEFPVRVIQDTDDPLRFTVVCDLRLSWEAPGRAEHPGQLAGDLSGTYEP